MLAQLQTSEKYGLFQNKLCFTNTYCAHDLLNLIKYEVLWKIYNSDLQEPTRVDFTDNPMAETDFKFYDKSLLDDVKRGDPNVHEFFRLLALCHTVMPEYKEGNY